MCDPDIEEFWDVESQRVARKSHVCIACRERIAPGDTILEALWAKGVDGADLRLNCGEVWESPPPHVEALAFWVPSDGDPAHLETRRSP